jgi:methenyltetrahydrofolate cyclohydrolase
MTMGEMPIGEWLEALASRTPAPGGGAVAALCAATSASLLGMVAEFTTGGKWADRTDRMRTVIDEVAVARVRAVELADADAAAFAAVGDAYRLPKETEEQKAARREAIQAALIGAAEPPVLTGELAARLVVLADELAESGNPNVLSDVAVAASSAQCALESAIVNIEINLAQIRDDDETERLAGVIERLAESIAAADRVTAVVRKKVLR